MNKHGNVYVAKNVREYFISIHINGPIFFWDHLSFVYL
ncbi:hypothetical protein BDFB_000707 [Asbolus verrucosus]|uniref:Uncharacterized protein n=1 Tax=Asbolus verrucosus TaxID=1661398 RepID=A0A482WAY2_ASBVE|nr:hypothetical protein BDFB_000707 [Asbolus verrucosus]